MAFHFIGVVSVIYILTINKFILGLVILEKTASYVTLILS